jgi:hypothetical protein
MESRPLIGPVGGINPKIGASGFQRSQIKKEAMWRILKHLQKL